MSEPEVGAGGAPVEDAGAAAGSSEPPPADNLNDDELLKVGILLLRRI